MRTPSILLLAMSFAQGLPNQTIVENAEEIPELAGIVGLLGAEPAILELLSMPGNFTLFAPNDAALASASLDVNNVQLVGEVLKYHALDFNVQSGDLGPLQFPETLMSNPLYVNLGEGQGQRLQVTKDESGAVNIFNAIGGGVSHVVTADIECSNGVIHIVDQVLYWPGNTSAVLAAEGITALLESIDEDDIEDFVISPHVTVFAPSNLAFAELADVTKVVLGELFDDTLENHLVVSGEYFSTDLQDGMVLEGENGAALILNVSDDQVSVNGYPILKANLQTMNGAVHVIDGLLLPPASPELTVAQNTALTPDMQALVSLLGSAGYEAVLDTLQSAAAPVTLFAPTSTAFEDAGLNTSDAALLSDYLRYHMLDRAVTSDQLDRLQFESTLLLDPAFVNLGPGQGQVVKVAAVGGDVTVNQASVVVPDILASNGVLHVINKVLLPPDVTSAVATAAGLSIFVGKAASAQLTDALDRGMQSVTVFIPTNEAFTAAKAKDGADTETVLLRHVFPQRLYSSDLEDGMNVTSLANTTYTISIANGTIAIGDTGIILTAVDLLTENAAVHIITGVLGDTAPAPAPPEHGLSTLAIGAIAIGSLVVCGSLALCCTRKHDEDDEAYAQF